MALLTLATPTAPSQAIPTLPGMGSAVTPHDTDTWDRGCAVWAMTTGSLVVRPANDPTVTVTIPTCPVGFVVPFLVVGVTTASTASNIFRAY